MSDVIWIFRNKPATEPPLVAGEDFDQAPWTAPYSLWECALDYIRERLHRKRKDCQRAWISFRHVFDVIDAGQDVTTITESQIEDFVEYRIGQGRSVLTPRKDLAFLGASIRYAHRRHRIDKCPYIELPEGKHKHRRPLTMDEYHLVMRQAMSRRLRRFYRLGGWTGQRSKALEELDWSRVNWTTLTMDFNVPGKHATNKRRVANFPIPDEAIPILRAWQEVAGDDPYVIGRGGSTYVEAAYVVRELAGLTDPSLVPRHCLRKMFATEMVERMIAKTGKADMSTLSALTGDDARMLEKHYIVPRAERMRDAVNLLAA